MDNLPEVTRNNRDNYSKGFGDDFTLDFMMAMGELRDSLKVKDNEAANVALTKINGDLNGGDLLKLQKLNKTRKENMKYSGEIKSNRKVEVRAQIESVGISEDDSMDAKFQKLKEALDMGEVEILAGLPLGAMCDAKGDDWEAGDAGLW